jgi:fermentation-respiration switch protein FrsA (DUF1100 family)
MRDCIRDKICLIRRSMKITEEACFYPDRFVYFDPAARGFDRDDIWIAESIHCWLVHPGHHNAKDRLVVHLHGNAENMTTHITGVMFLLEAGFPVLTFDYRGYGRSPGTPTLSGIQEDARQVFSHVLSHPEIFGGPVFGFGQSMGAYTLARILPEFPTLKGAILEAGLHSFHELFRQAYPDMECEVPSEGYSALETLPKSTVPKLFIHGTADQVVPYTHSIKMYEASPEPKDILILEGVGHMDAFISRHFATYREKIMDFLRGNG